jgi:hypothetical protein
MSNQEGESYGSLRVDVEQSRRMSEMTIAYYHRIPAPEGRWLRLSPGGIQFSHSPVIERNHSEFRGSIEFILSKVKAESAPKGDLGFSLMRPASDLATLQQGIDVALSLTLIESIFGHDLSHEIVFALECGQVLLGELAPFRSDFLENHLLGLGSGLGPHSKDGHPRGRSTWRPQSSLPDNLGSMPM